MRTQAIGAGFEGLEERLLLAGNVVSALNAGFLLLTGDALANQVQLTVASNGQLTATGLSGTTIDGVASFNFGVVNTLTVLGDAGDDSISLNATAFSIVNDVSIDGGLDNDTISVTGRFGADLILAGGTGLDTITVNKATVAVDLNLDAGDGNNKVTVSNSTITQQAVIQTGAGNDTVKISGTSFFRDLTQSDTGGNNSLSITNSSTRNDLLMALGTGNDALIVTGVTVGARVGSTANGLLSIDFSEGKNSLTMSKSKVLGTGLLDGIVLTGGSGNDYFGMSDSQSTNGITIDTGDGANRVELTRVSITGIGDLEIFTGLGEDSVKLDRLLIGGATRLDTGLGNDILQITNSRFTGLFGGTSVISFATLGGGDNIAYVSNNFFARTGSVLSAGAGNADALTLGPNNPDNNITFTGFDSTRIGKL